MSKNYFPSVRHNLVGCHPIVHGDCGLLGFHLINHPIHHLRLNPKLNLKPNLKLTDSLIGDFQIKVA